ncbi:MAG: hypothetical protein KGD63_01920 [Candidatus Lokiarchaeota archaeon]|nr:hypothetical protein [Candidatus Lokiarchaeota archaeon]
MPKKTNHPNCPECTTNIKEYFNSYRYWSDFRIIKLYRLYARESMYIPIGWYCKKCGFILLEKKELNKPYNLSQQEIIVCNKLLVMEVKNKKNNEK